MTALLRHTRRSTASPRRSGVAAAAREDAARGALRGTGGVHLPIPLKHATRRGHTLLELVTSMAVTAVVMGGMMSVLIIAGRAVNLDVGQGARAAETGLALRRVAADMQHARDITELTPQAITVQVPDRTGNATPETVRYAWSGTPGDPLTHAYNGGTPAPLLPTVENLVFQPLSRDLVPPAPVESAEVLLLSHDDIVSGGMLGELSLTTSDWCAQYLRPSLPRNTISWRLTRVDLRMRRANAGSTVAVDIRGADMFQKPTGQVIQSISRGTGELPGSMGWVQIDFSPPTDLDPLNGACLVVRQENAGNSGASIQYQHGGIVMPQNTHWMTTGSAGSSWSNPENTQDLRFYAYGTYTTRGAPQW